jgi:hypothetical protein
MHGDVQLQRCAAVNDQAAAREGALDVLLQKPARDRDAERVAHVDGDVLTAKSLKVDDGENLGTGLNRIREACKCGENEKKGQ